MRPTSAIDRDLDFPSLLAEIHALVGQRVVVEVGWGARPVALEARGTLAVLADFQLVFGSSLDDPARLALTLEDSDAIVTLRENEVLSARSYTVSGFGGLAPSRHVQVFLRGGAELVLGVDRIAELLDDG